MGLFKSWLEGIAMGSDGQSTLPTQVAQDTANITNAFMNDPKSSPIMTQMAGLKNKPDMMNKFALGVAAPAAVKTSGKRSDQITTNTPAIAGQLMNSFPGVKNNFAKSIKPV